MFENKINYKLLNIILFMVAICLVAYTSTYWWGIVMKLLESILPFFLAFTFAYVLHPFVKKLENKGVRKSLAITIVVVLLLTIFGGALWVTVPMVYDQLLAFATSVVEFLQDFSLRFDVNLGDFSLKVTDTLNEIIKDFGKYVSTGTIDFLGKSVDIITNFFVVLIVGIYFLNDMDTIRSRVRKWLKNHNKKWYLYVKRLDNEMGRYLHGLFLLIIVTFFEYAIVFRLINHPNWIILSFLLAISTIVPYFGGIFCNIVAVVTASVVSPTLLIATLIVCFVFSNVDGYIISPRIYGKTNNISPLTIIFAVIAFGKLFGIFGIVISLPACLLLKATYDFFEKDIKLLVAEKKEER